LNNIEARQLLKNGGSTPDLCEAVWVVYFDPNSTIYHLAEGFKFEGIVEAQTRYAVMKRLSAMSAEEEKELADTLRHRLKEDFTKTNAPSCADEAR